MSSGGGHGRAAAVAAHAPCALWPVFSDVLPLVAMNGYAYEAAEAVHVCR